MPYLMRKLPGSELYRVRNSETGRIVAKATTKEKAEAQMRYLNSLYEKEKLSGGINTIGNGEISGLHENDNGIYCFLAYDRLDIHKNGVFKIGMTSKSFSNRLEGYHSYHPMGVTMVYFLMNPSKQQNGRTLTSYYKEIEKYIAEKLLEYDAYQIVSTTRHKPTEFFYSNLDEIGSAFEDSQKRYGGRLKKYNLNHLQKQSEKLRRQPHYTGSIYYQIPREYLGSAKT